MRLVRVVCLFVFFAGSQLTFAQGDQLPSIALLSFGTSPIAYSVTEDAILAQLTLDGFLSEAEYAGTDTRGDIDGEKIRVFALDAGWELDRLSIMVENAIDREADVLVAFTTPVAQAAINVTAEMEDPPAVIFASAQYPFASGLAEAPCVKASHITGSHIIPPYEQLVELVMTQQPEITTIGTVFSVDQIAGVEGSRAIVEFGRAQSVNVLEAAVTHPIDFIAAVDGLVSRGAEALILSLDTVTSRGLPAVVATASENLLPIYYPALGGISSGAMISAGTFQHVEQGVNVGRMVSAYLRGELDIATTAIDAISGDGIGVNLAVASALETEINTEIQDGADLIFAMDAIHYSERLEESYDADDALLMTGGGDDARAYLESLHCTADMIAEQQAALDAATE